MNHVHTGAEGRQVLGESASTQMSASNNSHGELDMNMCKTQYIGLNQKRIIRNENYALFILQIQIHSFIHSKWKLKSPVINIS